MTTAGILACLFVSNFVFVFWGGGGYIYVSRLMNMMVLSTFVHVTLNLIAFVLFQFGCCFFFFSPVFVVVIKILFCKLFCLITLRLVC